MKWIGVAVLASLAVITAYGAPQTGAGALDYKPGELLVKFHSLVPSGRRNAILAGRSATRRRHLPALDIDHVVLPAAVAVETEAARFRAMPEVEAVQPNFARRIGQEPAPPNDPYWLNGGLWNMHLIQADAVWNTLGRTGDGSVVIADIDTGISYNHPDLAANVWVDPGGISGDPCTAGAHGLNSITSVCDPMDDNGHGSHTAGILAAVGNNGIGVVGVNWNAKLLACKAFDASGNGTDADATACFDYIVTLKQGGVNVRVTNNSWGGARGNVFPTVLQTAIDAAGNQNILNVAAAGNSQVNIDTAPFDPASLSLSSPSVIAVAATDSTDTLWSYLPYGSNYGPNTVGLAAPGADITSTYLNGNYYALSGTSMATPHVAGTAALLSFIDPSLLVGSLKAILLSTVDPLPQLNGVVSSGGRLNAYKAALAVGVSQPPTVSITGPASGTTYTAPATVPITVTATESGGTVASVAFSANGALIGTSTTAPFSFTWTNVATGSYTVTAVATDTTGKAGPASSGVSITVGQLPTVSITSPTGGATYPAPATVPITVTATESGGTVASVAFSANGTLIGTSTTAPFNFTWTNVAAGSYTLTAVATDTLGRAGVASTGVAISVNPRPTVSIASPTSGTTYLAPATVPITVTATEPGGTVASVAFSANGTLIGTSTTAPFNFTWTNVAAGSYTLTAVATDTLGRAGAASSGVPITVGQLPTVSITSPTSGTTFMTPATVPITVSATEPGGTVASVAFSANGALIGTSTTAPFNFTWTNVAAGNYTLTAVATDTLGRAGAASSGVPITVNPRPTVSITSPASGSTYTAPATVPVTVSASAPGGTVASVAFSANGTLIGTSTTAPFNFTWTNVAAGSYTLTAVATDTLGRAGAASSGVPITVGQLPTVSITSPTSGTTFMTPATVPITVSATEPGGTVASVAFSANGALIGTSTTAPFNFTWTNVAAGNYTLTAVATDTLGRAGAASSGVPITVNPRPTVSITSPASGSTYTAPATVPVTVSATAPGGTVASVAFSANGTLIGTSTTAPFNFTWTSVAAGSYTLTAVATDTLGRAGAASNAVPITVNPVVVGTPTNVALVANGATAVASSTASANYSASSAITGNRAGLNWGNGGGWSSSIWNVPPDWLEVDFPATDAIGEIDVFSLQDNYTHPSTPTPTMTFTLYGLVNFEAQYWTGSAWADVPGGAVTNNNLVWRQFTFTPISTAKIRVLVNRVGQYTSIPDVEAWTAGGTPIQSPTVSMTGPASGTTYTAPATVPITVTATESGGTVASVAFSANGAFIGRSTTAPFSFTWTNVPTGNYTLTAVATDTMGRTGTASTGVPITVNPAVGGTPVNVALAANGATATASSSYNANFAAADAITGNRAGVGWGASGGWNSGTANVFPDWLEVDFATTDTIGEVDVFTLQDNWSAPSTPTPTMTFSLYGLKNFEVQYWTGTTWADVPGGAIVNNNLVWRQVTFSPLATSKIRIWVTNALASYSRVADVEAWTTSGTPGQSPTVSITSPASGTPYTAPATVPITVTATESGGTVASVAFSANGGFIGTSTTAPFSFTWTNVPAGSYTLTAVATDTMGRAGTASTGVPITVNPGVSAENVALAANGATAVASSAYSAAFAADNAITGDRAGVGWGATGGWNSGGSANAFPNWLEVDFASTETIAEVDVFTVQDNWSAPSTPTPTMTFSMYGLQDFEVQYWTGSAWADVPGGAVTNNNLVWRQFTFAPLVTPKIRIWVTDALGSYSRITDVEAWTSPESSDQPSAAAIASASMNPSAPSQPARVPAAPDQARGADQWQRRRPLLQR